MATIERRAPRTPGGAHTYVVRFRDPGGVQRSKSHKELREAKAFRAKVELDVRAGTYIDPALGKTLIRDYAASWLAMQTFSLSTRAMVTVHVDRHIVPELGDTRLAALQVSRVQAWIKGLETRKLAPTYVRGIFGTLRAILSAAVDDEIVAKNPCLAGSISLPKIKKLQVVPWTPEQTAAIVVGLPARYRVAGWIGALAGLRQGEILGLAVSDVDFLRGTLHVRRQIKIIEGSLVFDLPKGGKQRQVPLPKTLAELLAAHLVRYPARATTLPWASPRGDPTTVPLILTTRQRGACDRNYINTKVWRPALRSAGLNPLRSTGMHALRHSYASVLLSQGVDIRSLAEYLGHSDAGFTLRVYTHLMPDAENRTRRALDSAFANAVTAPLDSASAPSV